MNGTGALMVRPRAQSSLLHGKQQEMFRITPDKAISTWEESWHPVPTASMSQATALGGINACCSNCAVSGHLFVAALTETPLGMEAQTVLLEVK